MGPQTLSPSPSLPFSCPHRPPLPFPKLREAGGGQAGRGGDRLDCCEPEAQAGGRAGGRQPQPAGGQRAAAQVERGRYRDSGGQRAGAEGLGPSFGVGTASPSSARLGACEEAEPQAGAKWAPGHAPSCGAHSPCPRASRRRHSTRAVHGLVRGTATAHRVPRPRARPLPREKAPLGPLPRTGFGDPRRACA